jgi:HEAT repeat protein
MTDDDVSSLLQQLQSADRKERLAAARALGELRAKEAVPPLIQALDDRYAKVRVAAIDALARIGDERAIPPILRMAAAKQYHVRTSAGRALGHIPGALPHLLRALEDERSSVREQVVTALGRTRDQRAFASLVRMLDDKSLGVRTRATRALERLGDKRAIPHLSEAVKRKTKSSRSAATAIGQLGGVAELAELMEDRRSWVRLSAVEGLRSAGEAGTPHIVRALDDPHQQVRLAAAKTLAQRGDERAVPALQALLHAPGLSYSARQQVESYLKKLTTAEPPLTGSFDDVWSHPGPGAIGALAAAMQNPQLMTGPHLDKLLPGVGAIIWIDELLEHEANVLLTPTWIAQAQKTSSQRLLIEAERDTLWPMARELMGDLWLTLADESAREWAGTALALLNELKGSGAIARRVQQVLDDPASTPRGHYEEGMHGYFRGMQFLFKSVFDVALNPDWCQHMAHYVLPWSALPPILKVLKDHAELRQRWEDLHRFYTVFAGTPDSVCIRHLLVQDEVTQATVERMARGMHVPKINQKMGLGVQGLGERYTHHGQILEQLKETFIPDVSEVLISRESVYAVVNMRSLLYGLTHGKGQIPMLLDGQVGGLMEALAPLRRKGMSTFVEQFLMAQYELVADLPAPDVTALVPGVDPRVTQLSPDTRRRLNSFAANLATLLELSILSSKQPVKAVALGLGPTPRSRVYVEKAPQAFFQKLGRAGQTVADLCQDVRKRYGIHPPDKRPTGDGAFGPDSTHDYKAPTGLRPIYDILGELSQSGRCIPKASKAWYTIAPLVERLARNPNITADAYRHAHGGTQYFLQWCTAMAGFYGTMSDGARVEGAELLFVEGWNDQIVPGHNKPLTNSAWQDALSIMRLSSLRDWTIAPM